MDEKIEDAEKPKSRAWIVLIIVVLVIAAAVVYKIKPQQTKNDEPPLLIKNLPINLAPFDVETGMAGDVQFTIAKLQFDALYMDYAFEIPASPDYPAKKNVQPTFLAPLGTKVHSIVDGEVIEIGKLYSNDYSIAVGIKNSLFRYETEHVINPLVKVGDKVKAGDVIAEVSDFGSDQPDLGVVEIGILKTGKQPTHICPFLYLDPAVKDKIIDDLKTLYSDWNAYKGKTIYNLCYYKTFGCLTE